MACQASWEQGQKAFSCFEDYKSHTYRLSDANGGREFTVYNVAGEPVAYLYLMIADSWHRQTSGLDLTIFVARSDARSSRKVLETVRHIIESTCVEFGLGWYQRSKKLSDSSHVVSLKEIK